MEVPRDEVPAPTIEMLTRRTDIGKLLSAELFLANWSPEDAGTAREFKKCIGIAHDECNLGLPKVVRERRRYVKTVPRWQEPSPDFLSFAHARSQGSGGKCYIALHLSNLPEL